MPVSDLQRQVTVIALRAIGRFGFALAGGCALNEHGLVDRYTQDVDLFTDRDGGVEAAAGVAEAALCSAGFDAERRDKTAGLADIWDGMGEGLAEWLLTAPDGQQTTLQLAHFSRDRQPVTMSIGPVLDLEDLVASKTAALATRAEPRDYIDIAAALERYTQDQLISLATRHDPGLESRDFADAGRRLDQLGERRFAALGLSSADVAALRERFASWPR